MSSIHEQNNGNGTSTVTTMVNIRASVKDRPFLLETVRIVANEISSEQDNHGGVELAHVILGLADAVNIAYKRGYDVSPDRAHMNRAIAYAFYVGIACGFCFIAGFVLILKGIIPSLFGN